MVPGAACGSFVGGTVAKCLDLKVSGLLRMCIICVMLILGLVLGFLLRCSDPQVVGVTVPYHNEM